MLCCKGDRMKSVYKVLGAVLGGCVLALSLPAMGGKFVKYPLQLR